MHLRPVENFFHHKRVPVVLFQQFTVSCIYCGVCHTSVVVAVAWGNLFPVAIQTQIELDGSRPKS